jgi:prephenate dehydrogenase
VTIIGHDADATKGKVAQETVLAIDQAEWNLVKAARKADIVIITTPAAELESILQVIGRQ